MIEDVLLDPFGKERKRAHLVSGIVVDLFEVEPCLAFEKEDGVSQAAAAMF